MRVFQRFSVELCGNSVISVLVLNYLYTECGPDNYRDTEKAQSDT